MKRFLHSLLAVTLLLGIVPTAEINTRAATDDLIWPCESAYYITCMYYYKTGGQHSTRYGYDKSMDIAGGGNIVAAEGGIVETATDLGNTSFGRYVVIKHPSGHRSLYAHLDSYCVSVGQSVTKGQKIGVMGTTGNSSGTHLHFEYSGGDPWKLFYNEKYAPMFIYEQNVRSNNDKYNSDKTVVEEIDRHYYKKGTYYYYREGSHILGDVNGDEAVNQYDYLLVARHHFGTLTLTEEQKTRADVNNDRKIDQYDYLLIARHHFGTYVIK